MDAARARSPFPLIASHVLLDRSAEIEAADKAAAGVLTPDAFRRIIAQVPDTLLEPDAADGAGPAALRQRYLDYLVTRMATPRAFVAAAVEARERQGRMPSLPQSARR